MLVADEVEDGRDDLEISFTLVLVHSHKTTH